MKHYWIFAILLFSCCLLSAQGEPLAGISLFPANGSTQINPDTHLVLTFPSTPTIGNSGKIRVYDASDDRLVDVLDMSIPPGPTQPHHARIPYTEVPYVYIPGHWTNANTQPGTHSGTAQPTPDSYQLTIIGGFTDGFHFYPIIVHDNVATITLHHNLLEYNKTYYVQIDPGVLTLEDNSFAGIPDKTWTFSTKTSPPPADSKWLVVNADGSDDFKHPPGSPGFPARLQSRTCHDLHQKRHLRRDYLLPSQGEHHHSGRGPRQGQGVLLQQRGLQSPPGQYHHQRNPWYLSLPSRRLYGGCIEWHPLDQLHYRIPQSQTRPRPRDSFWWVNVHIVSNMTIIGQGDALQLNGSVYLENIQMTGYGDNVLSRGPCFFKDCELISTRGPHIWIRNPFTKSWLCAGRLHAPRQQRQGSCHHCPSEQGLIPSAEAVLLNCKLANIRPEGWSPRAVTNRMFTIGNTTAPTSVTASRSMRVNVTPFRDS